MAPVATKLDSSNKLISSGGVPLPVLYLAVGLPAAVYLGVLSARTASFILLLIASLVALLVYYQESVLYIPVIQGWKTPADNPSGYQSPQQQGLEYEDVYFTTADHVKLHGWFIPAPRASAPTAGPTATLLFCHENAGNIGLRIPEYVKNHHTLAVHQFVFDYRGYGLSGAAPPTEAGLVADALAAFEYLQDRARAEGGGLGRGGVSARRVVVAGRSLGGAVAIGLCAKLQDARSGFGDGDLAGGAQRGSAPAALVVENTFTSISDMVDAKFPVLNVPYFKELCLRLQWDSAAAVGRITLPLLLLSSTKDEIVPAAQMARLRDLAVAAPAKAFHTFDATHNDIWAAAGPSYWAAKKAFIQQHCE